MQAKDLAVPAMPSWLGGSLESVAHPFFVTERDKDRALLPWDYHQGNAPPEL